MKAAKVLRLILLIPLLLLLAGIVVRLNEISGQARSVKEWIQSASLAMCCLSVWALVLCRVLGGKNPELLFGRISQEANAQTPMFAIFALTGYALLTASKLLFR